MSNEIFKLKELSAKLGNDISLIQASGGNTSIKLDGNLWVKASGKKLKNALNEDIFVSLDLKKVKNELSINKSNKEINFKNICGSSLRASIETSLHAIMPYKVVLHTHSVDVIAITLMSNSLDYLKKSLKGINWKFIPYFKPGVPLANAISKELKDNPANVLVLANHGLVVAEESTAKAEILHKEIISRLRQKTRHQIRPNIQKLNSIINKIPNSRLPSYQVIHSLATDKYSFKLAQNNSPFPDHLVFCGKRPLIIKNDFSYKQNTYGIIEGVGVLLFKESNVATEEMLNAQAEVFLKIPKHENINFLSDKDCNDILNLESEKYRKNLYV
tara:strand:+ start:183 stop:1172 length:990 start_codon:yes stop_codon:yes gene_type:complete